MKHRSDIKANRSGLGSHFSKHAEEMGIYMDTNILKLKEIMERYLHDELMKKLQLQKIL